MNDGLDYEYAWPPYGDAAGLLENAIEPTAQISAAAAHQAAQDRRLDALEAEVVALRQRLARLEYVEVAE